jgi:hypothetical protein
VRDKEDTWEMRSIDQELEHAGAESWGLGPGGGRTGEHKRKSYVDRLEKCLVRRGFVRRRLARTLLAELEIAAQGGGCRATGTVGKRAGEE